MKREVSGGLLLSAKADLSRVVVPSKPLDAGDLSEYTRNQKKNPGKALNTDNKQHQRQILRRYG